MGPKFKIGSVVVYSGGLFTISDLVKFREDVYYYKIGDGSVGYVHEDYLTKADWRDVVKILNKGNKSI